MSTITKYTQTNLNLYWYFFYEVIIFYKLYYCYVIIFFDTTLLFNPHMLQGLRGRFRNIQIDYVSKRECRAETLNFGKRSSDDERRCETMVGSTDKIKDHKSLYDTTSWSCNCVVFILPCISCSFGFLCFELIELSENLLFVTSFIRFIIS